MIVFFTGTGNSRYVAQYLAVQLGDSFVDAGKLIQEGTTAALRSNTPWVFVCPTYAWQIPHIFRDWIRSGDFRGSRAVYFVMTCGGGIAKAEKSNNDLCLQKAFLHMGTIGVVMPDNYIAMYDTPTPQEAEKIRLAAHTDLDAIAACIDSGMPFEAVKHGPLDGLLSSLLNKMFCTGMVKADKFFATEACTGCGSCVTACVCKNITLIAGHPRWEKNCIHCMACICSCPQNAIEYGKKTSGRIRYLCPSYDREGKNRQ